MDLVSTSTASASRLLTTSRSCSRRPTRRDRGLLRRPAWWTSASAWMSSNDWLRVRRELDDDIGRLDRGDHTDTWRKAELVGSFAAQQGDDAVRACLDLDVRHHLVLDDLCHQALEA